jgi:formate-nitrite transporter family protein
MKMASLSQPVTDRDHVEGPEDAPVTLVEYGDFECPYCGEAYPVVKQLQAKMGDHLRFVFRQFPLTETHAHAEQAAEASECAAAQGQFWEYHDYLYENQDFLDHDSLLIYAEQMGLDRDKFQRDLDQHTFLDRIREDYLSGIHSGVNGTPTFYINGERFDGSPTYEGMLEALQERV